MKRTVRKTSKTGDVTRFYSPKVVATAKKRGETCKTCSQNRGLTDLTVKCKATGCAGLSLVTGRCPKNQWDKSHFDRVSVLSLDRRTDRLSDFRCPLPWERARALDGLDVPAPSWWKQGAPAWCCYRGHLRSLEDALNDKLDTVLLLEDDAVFAEGFSESLEQIMKAVPSDWEQLYLGGHHLFVHKNPPVVLPGSCLSKPFNVNGTFAMAFRGDGIRKAYEWLNDVEDWMRWPRHHVDHRLGIACERGLWNVYSASPFIVGHAAGPSNISGREGKEEFFNGPATNVATKTAPDPPVIVLGCFHGGTSMVSGMLQRLGVDMGGKGNKVDGIYDSYEDHGLKQLMLGAFKEPHMSTKAAYGRLTLDLRAHIASRQKDIGTFSRIGMKHPSLCACIPQLYEAMGNTWKALVISRDLDAVKHGLDKVNWWKVEDRRSSSEELYKRRDKDLFRHPPKDLLHLDYDTVLRDPQAAVNQICNSFGLMPTKEQQEAAVSFVQPSKPATVWSYWEGPKSPLIELCLDTLRIHNPEVKILTFDTFLEQMEHNKNLIPRLRELAPNVQSDFIRSYLLHHYGGVWCDADAIHFQPMTDVTNMLKNYEFFAYREYSDRPANLCTALMGSRGPSSKVIAAYHGLHLQLVGSGCEIKNNRLGPTTLMNSRLRNKDEELGLFPVGRVMPIHFSQKSEFHDPMPLEQFELLVHPHPQNSIMTMLTHGVIAPVKTANREKLMESPSFIGHALRKGFKYPPLG
jgi:hypothetical protein